MLSLSEFPFSILITQLPLCAHLMKNFQHHLSKDSRLDESKNQAEESPLARKSEMGQASLLAGRRHHGVTQTDVSVSCGTCYELWSILLISASFSLLDRKFLQVSVSLLKLCVSAFRAIAKTRLNSL